MFAYKAAYLAYSKDSVIRYRASSGGFVKSILCYLLDTGKVDYAIVTRTGGKESPLQPETIVTNSRAEITSSRTNSVFMVHDPFKGLELDPSKRYAMVCLPCQVKVKCAFVISLMCHHAPLRSFTEEILSNLGVSEDEVAGIEYRGKGWQGHFTAYLKNGQERMVAITQYWNSNHKPAMCEGCRYTGQGADILAGDPRQIKERRADDLGQTLVVCLTDKGHKAVLRASDYVHITRLSREELLQADKWLREVKHE